MALRHPSVERIQGLCIAELEGGSGQLREGVREWVTTWGEGVGDNMG